MLKLYPKVRLKLYYTAFLLRNNIYVMTAVWLMIKLNQNIYIYIYIQHTFPLECDKEVTLNTERVLVTGSPFLAFTIKGIDNSATITSPS